MINAHMENVIENWRQTRQVAYIIAAANRNPKKSFPTIHKFMPLPGDEEMMKEKVKGMKEEYQKKKEKYIKLGII